MLPDFKPILFVTDPSLASVELYFAHDLHKGSAQFDDKKWTSFKREVLSSPNRFVVFVGDLMENATPSSKSDMFYQTMPPHEQKEWVSEQFRELKDRIVGVTPGNHERNRSTRTCGLFPLYDACAIAGIEERYRPHFLMLDLAVGTRLKSGKKYPQQIHYPGFCVHRAKDMRSFSSSDAIDGIDFFACGHDHDPKDRPRGKLVYDPTAKQLSEKTVEVVNCGSFLDYGGYAVDSGYRPTGAKLYKLVLDGRDKAITSVGFQLK